MELVLLFIGAALVNNIVLSRFLGICPFMGVSKNLDTAFGMSIATTFVMMLSSIITWLIDNTILIPFNLSYLQTVVFVLVIAALVQFVEIVMEKSMPQLHSSLGIFLPLITTNCAILGVAILNVQLEHTLTEMIIFSFGTATGFGIALILFAGLRQRLLNSNIPNSFKDIPIAFITAGILSLAFMGFSGMVK